MRPRGAAATGRPGRQQVWTRRPKRRARARRARPARTRAAARRAAAAAPAWQAARARWVARAPPVKVARGPWAARAAWTPASITPRPAPPARPTPAPMAHARSAAVKRARRRPSASPGSASTACVRLRLRRPVPDVRGRKLEGQLHPGHDGHRQSLRRDLHRQRVQPGQRPAVQGLHELRLGPVRGRLLL